MRSRGTFRLARWVPVLSISAIVAACQSGDLIIGDDTLDGSTMDGAVVDASLDASLADTSVVDSSIPDSSKPDIAIIDSQAVPDGQPPDVQTDAPTSCGAVGGACLSANSACKAKDTTGATCSKAGDFCCKTQCPTIVQPPPTFCDGGTTAPTFDTFGCTISFACAPVKCAAAGGSCVPLVPGSCATNHYGDALKYDCGIGLGVTCCLP